MFCLAIILMIYEEGFYLRCFIRSKGPIVFFPCYCVLSFASTFFPQGPIQNHHTFLRICLILCATFFYVQNKNISTNVSFGGSLWIHNKA